ncbi:MAG TPA: isocitrate lyase/phosphoenolpyruvate mutase family protein [Jiangellaceae bacterium]|nr:isocitrate lyase/phosphoenolpyruvate mutase family protein [Jiangellaceae bacterium]
MAADVKASSPGGAAQFRALHRRGEPVILPNAWDAASARAVEAAGFPAVATSSAAVAESLGYSDGESTPAHEMLDAVSRIVRVLNVPGTVDMERGYGMAPAELVERLAATGAVGCNLEDSDPRTGRLIDMGEQVAFLGDVRAAANSAGLDLVINARIDTYLMDARSDEPVAETRRRALEYRKAGADCVYPIKLGDGEAIARLVDQIGGPVNILYRPGGPTIAELAALGVARISFASGLYRAVHGKFAELLAEIRLPAAGRS